MLDLPKRNLICWLMTISVLVTTTCGQPFFLGSGSATPLVSGQASSASAIPSSSRSGGQPFFLGSSLCTPLTLGQASSASAMPSPSLSGGQPFFLGSSLCT